MSLTSFGMIAEPLLKAPGKCIGDALVNKDSKVLQSYFPPVEVRILSSVAGGLMPAGTASTSMMTVIFPPPLFRGASVERARRESTGQNSTRLLSLLKEGHINEIKANSAV